MRNTFLYLSVVLSLAFLSCLGREKEPKIPANTWVKLARDEDGARRASSFRYVGDGGYFLLWGFTGFVTEFYGEPDEPTEKTPEYDIVVFHPDSGRWQSQLPFEKEAEWSKKLPPLHLCKSYQGITTGSYRPQLKMREGVLRPDMNIVFDQVAYDPKRSRMVYFTGGRTFAYDVKKRSWSDIGPEESPPPVMGGSLCYDPFNDQMVLVGGGHVAEPGTDGKLAGYTGTWIYDCGSGVWRPLDSGTAPGPRMASRLVCDTKNKVLVIFGGDAQSHYLADTWIYDCATRRWRESKAGGVPPARAGHFTVYDQKTGWIIIGGGYNREDLTDMWAYDAKNDRWMKLKGEVPSGWYVTADIVPERSLIILTAADKPESDTMECNEIYYVRTTYAFRLEKKGLVDDSVKPTRQEKMLKRSLEEATLGTQPDPARREAQIKRLSVMPENQWVLLSGPGRVAPLRTWGSCSFDTRKGRIIYWGGGHCGYGGSDYDFYDMEENTWITSPKIAEYPERAWDKGVNSAGVTFGGEPWMTHGRKIYAYDPVSDKIINMKTIVLTAGYEPALLKDYEPKSIDFSGEKENFKRSGYSKWVTWAYDPEKEIWEIVCSGLQGLELTVSTPRGVMAVNADWGSLYNKDRTDLVPFGGKMVKENAVFQLDVAGRAWKKLSRSGPWPQNLYEVQALVYDSRRGQLILHGGGPAWTELWTFSLAEGRWRNMKPRMAAPKGGSLPECRREGVYIPGEDVFFTCGYPPDKNEESGVYVYRPGENAWYKVNIPPPPGRNIESVTTQNRAITYDPKHNLVLMVLGESQGDLDNAVVYALRYSHRKAEFVK